MEFGGNAEIMPMPKQHLRKNGIGIIPCSQKSLSIQEVDGHASTPSRTEGERGMLAGNVNSYAGRASSQNSHCIDEREIITSPWKAMECDIKKDLSSVRRECPRTLPVQTLERESLGLHFLVLQTALKMHRYVTLKVQPGF